MSKRRRILVWLSVLMMPLIMSNAPAPSRGPVSYEDFVFKIDSLKVFEERGAKYIDINYTIKNTGVDYIQLRDSYIMLERSGNKDRFYTVDSINSRFYSTNPIVLPAESRSIQMTAACPSYYTVTDTLEDFTVTFQAAAYESADLVEPVMETPKIEIEQLTESEVGDFTRITVTQKLETTDRGIGMGIGRLQIGSQVYSEDEMFTIKKNAERTVFFRYNIEKTDVTADECMFVARYFEINSYYYGNHALGLIIPLVIFPVSLVFIVFLTGFVVLLVILKRRKKKYSASDNSLEK